MQIFAGVGDHDNRYYVTDEMWATEPYKKFVHLTTLLGPFEYDNEYSTCSAQYISKNLILSAGHCTGHDAYKAENYKHEEFEIKLLETPYSGKFGTDDWAVFVVPDQRYYSDSYFDIRVPTRTTDVINAGWGWVRILSDEELNNIREILSGIPRRFSSSGHAKTEWVDEELYKDWNNCMDKAHEAYEACNADDRDCRTKAVALYDECPKKLRLLDTQSRLKASNCQILYEKKKFDIIDRFLKFPEVLATNCDNWQGNSGGGYISINGRYLYGICSYIHSSNDFIDSGFTSYLASALQFDKRIKELIEYYNSHDYVPLEKMGDQIFYRPTFGTNNQSAENQEFRQNASLRMDTRIQNLSQEKDELAMQVISEYKNIKDMNNKQLLAYLNKVVEHQVKSEQLEKLEKAYRDARENEQSTANKLLTAATVAATGLGGMEWARGAAEQWADEEAETEMAGYLAGMRCEYGGGQTLNLGAEMTLPAGDLTDYYTEYKQLADKLKETKAALNLRPGIESEVLYDQAQSGLYQYQTAEVQSGGNPSLSRALMNPDGEDATAWNAQKAGSAEKAESGKGWGIGGAVGGALGNIGINNTDLIKNISGKNGN